MSVRFIKWAALLPVKDAYEKAVLMILAEAANGDTGVSFLAHKTIADRCSMSQRQVVKVMAALDEAGHIERRRRNKEGGRRATDIVTLTPSAQRAPWDDSQSARHAPWDDARGAPQVQPKVHAVHSITLTNNPKEYIGEEDFEAAWVCYPHHPGRSSLGRARVSFAALASVDQSALVSAAKRFRDEYLATNASTTFVPAFEKWIASGLWRNSLSMPSPSATLLYAWSGPVEIRAAVVCERGEDFAVSYLDPCHWTDGTIIARTRTARDKLSQLECLESYTIEKRQEVAA